MNGQVVAEISIVPVGTAEAGVSKYIAASLEVLEGRKDLIYRLTPMGTIIQGPLTEVLDAIKAMHEIPFSKGALRVVTDISIDDRRDKPVTMAGKIESVRKLRPSIKT